MGFYAFSSGGLKRSTPNRSMASPRPADYHFSVTSALPLFPQL
jgi:hypothetical protein